MKNCTSIYLISLEGPEWSEAKEAHLNEAAAKTRCEELNKSLAQKERKSTFESMSGYNYECLSLKLGKFVVTVPR